MRILNKILHPFRVPTPKEIAARKLAEARSKIVEAAEAIAWSTAVHNYNLEMVERMQNILNQPEDK